MSRAFSGLGTLGALLVPPPAVVRAAKEGLRLRGQYGRGGTEVGLATARLLVSGKVLTPEKVRHISRYFPRHAGDRLDLRNPPSNGWIAWNLWGGNAGRAWSERVVRRIMGDGR